MLRSSLVQNLKEKQLRLQNNLSKILDYPMMYLFKERANFSMWIKNNEVLPFAKSLSWINYVPVLSLFIDKQKPSILLGSIRRLDQLMVFYISGIRFHIIRDLPYSQVHVFCRNWKQKVAFLNPEKMKIPLSLVRDCLGEKKNTLLKINWKPEVLRTIVAWPHSPLAVEGSCWHEAEQQRWQSLSSLPLAADWPIGLPIVALPFSGNQQWEAGPHAGQSSWPTSGKGWGHQGPLANQWLGRGSTVKRLQKWYCTLQAACDFFFPFLT